MKKSERFYYKSCKTLPLYNFYELLNTKNYNWLIKGYSEDSEDPTDVDNEFLANLFNEIVENYQESLNGKKDVKQWMIVAQVNEMEVELKIVATLLDLHLKEYNKDIEQEIISWGYDPEDPKKVLKDLEGLKFRISIFKGKNKDLFSTEEDKETKEKVYDLYKDIASVEYSLGTSIVIDPYKTVVDKWVNYILIIEKKNGKRSN